MRCLAEMLEPLTRVLHGDAARQTHANVLSGLANKVAQQLPLVHRTCKHGAEATWREVLRTRTFAVREPCTGDREKAAGIPRAVYFFLGCGPYPEGLLGFVIDAPSTLARPASYTPFDTGSIEAHAVPTEPALAAEWDGPSKDRFLADHVGTGSELAAFSGAYLAAHFLEPMTYIRSKQCSDPDFPAYHGLRSTTGDRRAWTIEVQAHEDVAFGAGGGTLLEIVAARRALVEDLPDDLVGLARVAVPENGILESIADGIAERITAGVA